MRRLPPKARLLVAGLFVLLTSTYAIRSAMVAAYLPADVEAAATVWPEHPRVLAALSQRAIAEAAAQQRPLPPEASGRMTELAERAPLSHEPFVAAGMVALAADQHQQHVRAEQLLLAARTRAPRTPVTRYLLAELYGRENSLGPALREFAVFRRLTPTLSAPMVSALAHFVQREGPMTELRVLLRNDPQLEAALLSALASDPRNAGLISSLARSQRGSGAAPPWLHKLLESLVQAGEFRKAHALWLQFAPASEGRAAQWTFTSSAAPSPFTWQFNEESAGSARPTGDGLEVFYSGRQTVNLASKLVLLAPGAYTMSQTIIGTPPSGDSVRWSLTCLPSKEKIIDLPVLKKGRVSAQFGIPESCIAQQLELTGLAQSIPESTTFTIAEFDVARGQRR